MCFSGFFCDFFQLKHKNARLVSNHMYKVTVFLVLFNRASVIHNTKLINF